MAELLTADDLVNPTTTPSDFPPTSCTVTTPTVHFETVTTNTTSTTPTNTSVEIAAATGFRLPGFWRHSPKAWFVHADAIFHTGRIRSDLSRVNHVLSALDEDGIRTIADLLGPNATYESIRARLLNTYNVPKATKFHAITQPGGLGDRTPSRLLRDMREVYPDDMGDSALEQFWFSKLPPAVRTVIAGLTGMSLDALAERADRIWEAYTGAEVAAINTVSRYAATNPAETTSDAKMRAIEDALLKLTTQVNTLAAQIEHRSAHERRPRAGNETHRSSQSRSSSRTPHAPGWCYYHALYGADAQKCRDPCTYERKLKN